ncbi:RHS repeat domain-containing protein [Streptomyces sp. NPDC056730]|uniref:RHS repeat domain-containing protein n=1 Tax=unclassified Streptomyces TaxID=2593676 RepID=UPI0036938188
MISPTEGVTPAQCQADPAQRGCRVVEFVYATTTTATTGALGNQQNRVQSVRLWATEPGADKATPEIISRYAYDSTGRLREVWDPRIGAALKTSYTYDADGRIATRTEGGALPWTFTYGKAGSALTAGTGMLLKASRPGLAEGTATTKAGTAATTVVYDVPLSGSKAPYQMNKGAEMPEGATASLGWGLAMLGVAALPFVAAPVVLMAGRAKRLPGLRTARICAGGVLGCGLIACAMATVSAGV